MNFEDTNGSKLQSVISDELFPQVQHVSDVKQVLSEMESKAQNIREPQLKAIIKLQTMGDNKYLHPNGNPYKKLLKDVSGDYKTAIAKPDFYLDVIAELIPKPPRPIVMADGKQINTSRR